MFVFMNTKYETCKLLYLNGRSISSLHKEYNLCPTSFKKYLLKEGIHVRSYKKSSIINDIFDTIDSEEKAYWLGFIYADGYVSSKRNYFEITLKSADSDHLEKLRHFLGVSNKVSIKDNKCRLSVGDKRFRESLMSQGVVPRKSLTLKYPETLNGFDIPFIRGYFDGDGSVSYNPDTNKLRWSLIGTEDMLRTIKKKLNSTSKLTLYRDKRWVSKETYYISTACNPAISICTTLYQNSSIHLERKYLKYIAVQSSNRLDNEGAKSVESEILNTEVNHTGFSSVITVTHT